MAATNTIQLRHAHTMSDLDTADSSPLARLRSAPTPAGQRPADLEALARLIEAGQLTPVIGRTYPLRQAPDAMRHLQAGHTRGSSSSR